MSTVTNPGPTRTTRPRTTSPGLTARRLSSNSRPKSSPPPVPRSMSLPTSSCTIKTIPPENLLSFHTLASGRLQGQAVLLRRRLPAQLPFDGLPHPLHHAVNREVVRVDDAGVARLPKRSVAARAVAPIPLLHVT